MFEQKLVSCSGPLFKHGAEQSSGLHKSHSLPGEIDLPGQDASPPVKVPKGIRSNRLRRQGPNPASALGVKRNGGTSRVVKASSTVQEEFIKVREVLSSAGLCYTSWNALQHRNRVVMQK